MQIKLLGAHNLESKSARYVSLLIDDAIAIDAGALTAGLSFAAQQKLKAVLLTHQHYDHIRDIPALAMNFYLKGSTIEIYGAPPVREALAAHLLNDTLYPNFMERPPEKPSVKFHTIEPGRAVTIGGYDVLAVPVCHAVPSFGYQVTSAEGKAFFYSSDTGPNLSDVWPQISPRLLVIELTAPDRYEDFARSTGHLTPALLRQELEDFRRLKGYLPPVVLVHVNPLEEKKIGAEIAAVARTLKADIRLGHEGMIIRL